MTGDTFVIGDTGQQFYRPSAGWLVALGKLSAIDAAENNEQRVNTWGGNAHPHTRFLWRSDNRSFQIFRTIHARSPSSVIRICGEW